MLIMPFHPAIIILYSQLNAIELNIVLVCEMTLTNIINVTSVIIFFTCRDEFSAND